ncbi:MAG: tyrosyl-tRNA synthetase [Acidimicrobiaceae bacterium]|nr:tyrosyl-tRNA synthetase [Acidimicrobiaceae bacterium]
MPSLGEDLRYRGLVHQSSDPELFELLDNGHLSGYIGFDPSGDSLHVGNLLQLCNLRRFQLAGHRPIALVGGATGFIGDPGGKSEERNLLSPEQLEANIEGIRPQLARFLDFSPDAGPSQARLVNNADWLAPWHLIDFLRDIGKHVTVNQMVAKDSVRNRLERADQGISFTEFSYMLLQAADFLHLYDAEGCRLQMGGSDQWGNIVTGIDLVRRVRGATAFGLTSPLVLKADGTKFGKTESGAVWLDPRRTSPFAFYQFFFRTEDAVVGAYLRYFTFLRHDEIESLDAASSAHPERREAQRALAREVTTLVHGAAETERVERAAALLYTEDVVELDAGTLAMALADAPSSEHAASVLEEGLDLVEVLVSSGLVGSRSQARTAIEQGGAYVNNRRVEPDQARLTSADLLDGGYVLVRRGRRELHLLRFS